MLVAPLFVSAPPTADLRSNPERVRIEYALAPVEEIEEQVEVTDEEIAAYYEENKELFVEEEPTEAGRTGEDSDEPDEGSAAETTTPRYKELDAVRETIRGNMTLDEIEKATGVPAEYILDKLGLPANTAPDERVGRLLRTRGMEFQQLRRLVADYETD